MATSIVTKEGQTLIRTLRLASFVEASTLLTPAGPAAIPAASRHAAIARRVRRLR